MTIPSLQKWLRLLLTVFVSSRYTQISASFWTRYVFMPLSIKKNTVSAIAFDDNNENICLFSLSQESMTLTFPSLITPFAVFLSLQGKNNIKARGWVMSSSVDNKHYRRLCRWVTRWKTVATGLK